MENPSNPNNPTRPQTTPWWQPAVLVFFELSAWIGIPAVVALLIGNWIDTTYGTAPRGYYISVAVAFVVTITGFVKMAKTAKKAMDKMK